MAHWNRMPPPLAEYPKCRIVGGLIIDEKGSQWLDIVCKSCPKEKAAIRRVSYCRAFVRAGGYRCKSCANRESSTTHGMSYTPEYNGWRNAKGRAKRDPAYIAKGRKYDEKNLGKFEQFYEVMGDRPEGKPTVERIDNDQGYVMIERPDGTVKPNIMWASYKEQANNTSTNIPVEIDNVTYTLTQAAEKFGVSPDAFRRQLIVNKLTIEEALKRIRTGDRSRTRPMKGRTAVPHHKDGSLNVEEACRRAEVSCRKVQYFMKKGLAFDAAVERVKNPPVTIVELAGRHGLTTGGIQHHMRKGLTPEEAVERMLHPPETIIELAARHGLTVASVMGHLKRGKTREQAVDYLVKKRDKQQGTII
ncbi:MAG: hypothetical protein BVN29_18465 [Nitrospira sp. ST-bin5]|nr:MAG: hypothetical protein BVN29_18465 [Nitrospira sp. ST-bin5]